MKRPAGMIAMLALLVACSGASRDRVLRVFFDEPPARASAVVDTSDAGSGKPVEPVQASGTVPAARSTHPPFEDRECSACHAATTNVEGQAASVPVLQGEAGSPAKLRKPVEQLCVECHDDKAVKAMAAEGRRFAHAPVEDGDCTACHDPHRSRFASLLKAGDPIENLCFQCHERSDVLGEDPHADMQPAERVCTTCHDPHAGTDEALSK